MVINVHICLSPFELNDLAGSMEKTQHGVSGKAQKENILDPYGSEARLNICRKNYTPVEKQLPDAAGPCADEVSDQVIPSGQATRAAHHELVFVRSTQSQGQAGLAETHHKMGVVRSRSAQVSCRNS